MSKEPKLLGLNKEQERLPGPGYYENVTKSFSHHNHARSFDKYSNKTSTILMKLESPFL